MDLGIRRPGAHAPGSIMLPLRGFRNRLCVNQASLWPMSPQESPGSRTFPSPASLIAAATPPAGVALSVGVALAAGVWPPGPFLTSVIGRRSHRVIQLEVDTRTLSKTCRFHWEMRDFP